MANLAWTDNCDTGGNIAGTDSALSGSTHNGTITRTWNIADACGNNAVTRTQIITIIDATPPTFTSCPVNLTLDNDPTLCSAVANFTIPTATDNCSIVTVVQTDSTGLTSGDDFPVGVTTLEFTATDQNGNSSVCTFTVTVIDSEPPTIICPASIIVDADIYCEVSSIPGLIQPTMDDNCGNTYNIINNLSSLYPLPIGNHFITWTATDSAGLTTTCDQLITVVDVTSPVISCPSVDPFYNTDPDQCDATLSFTATATDACNASPIISYEIDGTPITFPYTFPVGTTNIVAIADDGTLTSTCNFNVVVEDNEAPMTHCKPINVTLDASGNASIAEDAVNNISTDACGGLTFDTDITDFDCSNIGVNTVVFTVTDASGNTDTCTTTVTVLDQVQGATASITSNPVSPTCLGESVTFTATGTNLGASPSYQWYVAGTPVGTDSATYTTTTLANGDDVYVEITSGPCDTLATSNTIIMTVNPIRPVEFTLNTSANPACSGEDVDFFITDLTNGGITPTYQWYNSRIGLIPGATNAIYTTSSLLDGDIISVEVISDLTCADPIPATESVTITINSDVTFNLITGNNIQTVCNSTSLTDITYIINNATNASVTGIPTGLSGSYTGGTFTISGTPTQIGVFNYTITPTGCGSTTATGTISVGLDATINLISPSENESICNNNSDNLNLQFQLNSGATGATLTSSPSLPAGISGSYNAGTGIYTISGTSNQPGYYNYTLTTTGCGPGESINGLITVNDGIPNQPNISGNTAFLCVVQQATYTVTPDPNVDTYNWTVSTGLSIVSGQSTNEIVIEFNPGFNQNETISVIATNACGSSSVDTQNVSLNFNVTNIDAGVDIYVCAGTTSVVMDGDAGGLNYNEWTWSDNGAGGSFSTGYVGEVCTRPWWCSWCTPTCTDVYDYSETSTYTIPASAQPGDIITISLESTFSFPPWCDPIESTMQIHILEEPEAEITSSEVTLCEGDSTNITFSGTPNAQIRYNDGSGNQPWVTLDNSGFTTVSVNPTTTTTYTLNRVRYQSSTYPGNNNCGTSLNESVTININKPPTVIVPTDVTICEGENVNLSSSNFSGTNAVATWSTSGNGTFSGPLYTPGALDILNGTVTLTYNNTPSDGICDTVSDSMTITINKSPSVYAGINQTICADGSVTLSGVIGGSASSATWSAPSGSFSSTSDLNATYTPSITSGTVTLTLTTNNPSGPCGATTDTVLITVNPAAIAEAGTDFTVCSSDSIVLNGALSGSATSGTWSTSTGGTFGNASALNTTYTPNATDISNGSVALTLTSNNPAGVCNPGVDTVVVTINEAATVDAGVDITTCSSNPVVSLNATSNTLGTWSGGSGTFNTPSLTNAEYTLGAGETSGTVTLTFTTQDPDASGPCNIASDTVVINVEPFVNADVANLTTINDCSDTTLQLYGYGSYGDGTWSAVSVPSGRPYSFSDVSNPNAQFSGESGSDYTITWTYNNAAPCVDDTASLTVSLPDCDTYMTFDGSDDSVNFSNNYNLTGNFSIEVWIKPNVINSSNIQTILSKRDAGNFATGYDLRLQYNHITFRANAGGLTANNVMDGKWHHVAVTYNGTRYTLYIDGDFKTYMDASGPAPNAYNMFLGAMYRPGDTPTNYFNGWLDELRIWDTALTEEQIRDMMNQEIENHSGSVRGSIVPIDVSGLSWNDLSAYYQMNQINSDITGGHLIANVGGIDGKLRNMTAHQIESAPLPYLSSGSTTDWDTASTWQNGSDLMIPNTNSVTWNIVSTQHNVTSNRPTQVLGLLVDNNTLTIADGNPITVSKYLKIDGTLDLEDESQLLQPTGSIVDFSGTGKLERDQQGTGNKFNYNYWGSPVSNAGSAINRTYALASILYDGITPVSWTTNNDAPGTNPATISSRWLYTYANLTGAYADWNRINENTGISVGLGYTMKGSGVGTSEQNYTFSGQPNNGIITHAISADNETLLGNPYPSAIDAHTFIDDNETALLDGSALIFWEQAPNNPSHILSEYLGRYSYLTKTGGVPATTPVEIGGDGGGTASKIPGRYIPVGQGFFVEADGDGGTLVFNNAQRIFKKEGSQSIFLRSSNGNEDYVNIPNDEESVIRRLRFNFTTPEGAVRHLLLGFTTDNVATDGIDYGYDALNADDFPSDLSFLIEGQNYVIQGVGEFEETKVYPLEMVLGEQGNIEIGLTELENFDDAIDVYIFDAAEGTYTRFNDVNFQMNLEAGTYSDRFFLVFQEDVTLSTIKEEFKDIMVRYLHDTDEIYVKTPPSVAVKQLYLINVAGQTIASWNTTNLPMSDEIKIPVKHISEGTYIIKAETKTSTFNKKIIIKY
ncbi:putative internalin [Winogradskyella psychrotolerans RS-3]|uniref:Putative internalin n=1 Tax=Winogradskyella psychrotolerans RS-3 TaxID=641526 RepID=S7VK81_9FLAO|nr:LamG-like jellyroll fold domain-containing protein [Winogradskyella psychrotolerans]EPR70595.1 putative internalin [Winogradskyella psychrotolerans RS-3]